MFESRLSLTLTEKVSEEIISTPLTPLGDVVLQSKSIKSTQSCKGNWDTRILQTNS